MQHTVDSSRDTHEQSSATAPLGPRAGQIRAQTRQLIIGIKRHFANDTQSAVEAAQQAFLNIKEIRLEHFRYKCQYCGFRSQSNSLTHLDSNHHNHDAENLVACCNLCHGYHHVGQNPEEYESGHTPSAQTSVNNHAVLIRAPADPHLSAQHFNHLLRAIAIALNDEREAPEALKVLTALVAPDIRQDMRESLVSTRPSDIALALSKLTEDEYRQSRHLLRDVRAIFSPDTLEGWGNVWVHEQPEIADPAQWSVKLSAILEHINPDKEGVGIEALEIDEDEEALIQYQNDLDLEVNPEDEDQ